MVDDKWNFKGKKLYDDGRVRIHVAESFPDEHEVVIQDNHIFLARGIMNEWARADTKRIASGYHAVRSVPYEIENPNVSIEEFGWALAKARNLELEDQVSDAYQQISDLKNS